ncbi:MAG: HAD-IA family hydrolase [Alphaproteobacteria bacterium]
MADPYLVVFDCDGTLVDTQHTIVSAMGAAWRSAGLSPPNPAAIRRVVGLPLIEAIATLHQDGMAADHAALAERYKESFHALERASGDEPLFPGIRETLASLDAAGILLGIATGKGRRGLALTLGRHDLERYFVTVQTADDNPGKPSPDMLLRAITEAGASAASTMMVGDTTFDMMMARNAGVVGVGVGWGYHDSDELRAAGAAMVVDDGAALTSALQSLMRRR